MPFICYAENDVEFSGFARLIAGTTLDSDVEYEGYKDQLNIKPDSLIGLQVDFRISDTLSATAQVLGVLENKEQSGLEWLYLNYAPNSSSSLKVGQLRTPFFTYSDVLDVGYAYPWIKPPTEVYASFFFSNFDGLDFQYNLVNKNFTTRFEAFYGNFSDEIEISEQLFQTQVNQFSGVIITNEINAFKIRGSYAQGDILINNNELTPFINQLKLLGQTAPASTIEIDGLIKYYQIGLNYDAIDYFLKSEWIKIDHDFHMISTVESYYATIGYQIGAFTAHATFANNKNKLLQNIPELTLPDLPEFQPIFTNYANLLNQRSLSRQKSWTLGLRWDIKPGLAFKTELKRLDLISITNATHDHDSIALFGLEWVF